MDVVKSNAFTICIDSLERLSKLGDAELSHDVLYVDEASSFLEFTHNEAEKRHVNYTHHILIRFVNNCNKTILSDAMINDNTANSLRSRKTHTTTLFIDNAYQKYKGKTAYRVRDEN